MLDILRNELFSRRNGKKIIEMFARDDNWHGLDKEKGDIGFGWIHYALIRITRPSRVLCIGSRWGFIPAICALACKENGGGTVDFVDAGYDMTDYSGPGEPWGGMGWWKKCDPKKYFGKYGLGKFINLNVCTSREFAKRNKRNQYGYVYVDGDHSYKGVKSDFELFWPKLNNGGFMVFHDINSADSEGNVYGTREFWKELKEKGYRNIGFETEYGLGIIQK